MRQLIGKCLSLKSGVIGSLGLNVYEEDRLFFHDLSNALIRDDVFARLLTFPNVLITRHQAFFTYEALSEIANKTIENRHPATSDSSHSAKLSN